LGVALTVKKNAYGLAFVLSLLFSAVAGLLIVNLAKADPIPRVFLPKIDINADGSITPDTGYISRNGSTYTLTSDIIEEYSINIWRSNIVFDGAGHTINITNGAGNFNVLQGVTNVTVKNLQVHTGYIAISLAGCSNCTVINVKTSNKIFVTGYYNTITQSSIAIVIEGGTENLIVKNNISYIFIFDGSSNRFSQNNILLTDFPSIYSDNFWDNGSVGNYWGNYTVKYSNASEIGHSGIGNTPYEVDRGDWSTKNCPNATNVDYYPLMYPYDIENDTIILPTREPFPTALAIAASAASIAIIGVGLLVYFKKRGRGSSK
jgi:hypothetical protein